MDLYHATLLVKAVVLAAGVALVFRAKLKPAHTALLAIAALMMFAGSMVILFRTIGFDFRIFWKVGQDVWNGLDPFAPERIYDRAFLNPPTALPLFALLAMVPEDISFLLWLIANLVACLALPLLSLRALQAQEGSSVNAPSLSTTTLVVLASVLLISDSSFLLFFVGQLSIIAAFALVLSLLAQAQRWPYSAGILLALATVKIGTMLPFLLLFRARCDRATWLSLAVGIGALCLLSGPIAHLPSRIAVMPSRIRQLEAPGKVNDYSFAGPRSTTMLGLDHALYRLGWRDRGAIRVAQLLLLAALGLWVAYQVRPGGPMLRSAACALIALYATIFLYHRVYDAVLLILPLVWCVAGARSAPAPGRWWYTGGAVAILGVLYLPVDLLGYLQLHSSHWGISGRIVQAVVLPAATWLILAAMWCVSKAAAASRTSAELSPNPRLA